MLVATGWSHHAGKRQLGHQVAGDGPRVLADCLALLVLGLGFLPRLRPVAAVLPVVSPLLLPSGFVTGGASIGAGGAREAFHARGAAIVLARRSC